MVVLKSSVRFVDYKIDLNSFLSSHRSDSSENKSGGKIHRASVQAAEFYLSILVFSTFRSFVHGLGFFSQEALPENVIMFLWNCREIILESYTLYRIQFARRLSRKQRRILACFNGVFTLMFCESISKIFNFSRTAEKKKLCEATTLSFLVRLPTARIPCLIVNKCRCV